MITINYKGIAIMVDSVDQAVELIDKITSIKGTNVSTNFDENAGNIKQAANPVVLKQSPFDPLDLGSTYMKDWCKDCPNNPVNIGYTSVGDSPCQWCSHSPYKITCTNKSTLSTNISNPMQSSIIENKKNDE